MTSLIETYQLPNLPRDAAATFTKLLECFLLLQRQEDIGNIPAQTKTDSLPNIQTKFFHYFNDLSFPHPYTGRQHHSGWGHQELPTHQLTTALEERSHRPGSLNPRQSLASTQQVERDLTCLLNVGMNQIDLEASYMEDHQTIIRYQSLRHMLCLL